MKKSLNLFLLSSFLVVLSSGCSIQSAANIKAVSADAQPTVDIFANTKPNVSANVNQTNAVNNDSYECARSTPKSIIKRRVFSKTNFTLQKNKDFPFESIGFETVEFENGDKLIIENTGCENYTLIFRFQTSRFSGKSEDARFWYRAAVQLIEQTRKGLVDETNLVTNGTKALNLYIKNNKTLKFDEEIDFGGTEIRDVVTLSKVKKPKGNRYKIELSFGIGPL